MDKQGGSFSLESCLCSQVTALETLTISVITYQLESIAWQLAYPNSWKRRKKEMLKVMIAHAMQSAHPARA